MPFTWGYVLLCAVQAVAVLVPRPSPAISWLARRPILGLIPLVAIGGVVVAMENDVSLAQRATDLAAFATPAAALAGVVAFRLRLLAVATPLLYLVAWRTHGRGAELAIDLLIVLACASLAWLTGIVAPRRALAVGIVVATVVDVYQVLVTESVQPVALALAVAAPPSDLPHLQQAVYAGATMGWGDVYLAALLGTVIALATPRRRVESAVVLLVVGVMCGFAFRWLDTLPATVPVSVALAYALLRERRPSEIRTVRSSEGGHSDGSDRHQPR